MPIKNSRRVTVYMLVKKMSLHVHENLILKNSETRQFNFPKMFSYVDLTSNFVSIQKKFFLINEKKESEIFVIKKIFNKTSKTDFKFPFIISFLKFHKFFYLLSSSFPYLPSAQYALSVSKKRIKFY